MNDLNQKIKEAIERSTRHEERMNPELVSKLEAALRGSSGRIVPLPIQPPASPLPIAKMDGAEGSSGKDKASINEN